MNTLKRTVEFIDQEKHRAIVDVEVTTRNGYHEFTASAQYLGHYGQCLDMIKPRTGSSQWLLISLWKEYHLKNVDNLPANVSFHPDFTGHVEGILDAIEEEETKRKAEETEEPTTDQLMEEFDIQEDMKEAVIAYLNVTGAEDLRDFEESYAGQFSSDEDFAEDMAESTGAMQFKDVQWPYTCIDWKQAARELMYDYSTENGYYFRNM